MADRNEATAGKTPSTFAPFAKRVFFVLVVTALALMVWSISRLLLAVFAGLLLSVLLRNLATQLMRFVPIGRSAAVSVVGLLIILIVAAGFSLFGAQLAQQFQDLFETLPVALDEIQEEIEESPFLQSALEQLEDGEAMGMIWRGLIQPVTGLAMTIMGMVVSVLVILLIAVYLSFSPDFYREGIVRLAPVDYRDHTREILLNTDNMLWKWLVGQGIAMAVVGALTTAGLMLLGAPMALALGLLTALLNFVPVIGPIIASIPAILVSFTEGPMLALYVLLLYVVVQQVESYVIMPLVQRWAVSLPPVLAVFSTIAAGILFGLPGAMLAVPLTVMIMGLVEMVYVESWLEGKRLHAAAPTAGLGQSGDTEPDVLTGQHEALHPKQETWAR